MRKWTSLGVTFGLVTMAASAANSEPQFQGRSLSDWAKQLDPHGGTVIAINGIPGPVPLVHTAIRSIGTNGIPNLIEWLKQKDPPDPEGKRTCFDTTPGQRAEMVFGILGEEARVAIPELTRLGMRFSDNERIERAIDSLAAIGPDALPSIKTILDRGGTMARWFALSCLPVFHSNAVVALPEAVKCLTSNNEEVSGKAADELSRLDVSDTVLVPALTNALTSASAASRGRIIRCLFWRDKPAYSAVPSLRAALTDRNRQVRWEATNALQKIAPNVLTNRLPQKVNATRSSR